MEVARVRGPEAKIVDKILKYLRKRGGWWMKVHGGMFQVGGIPDIIGCHKGQFYAFEVKTPEKYAKPDHGLTPRQQKMLADIERGGGFTRPVRSVEQVMNIMNFWEKL